MAFANDPCVGSAYRQGDESCPHKGQTAVFCQVQEEFGQKIDKSV